MRDEEDEKVFLTEDAIWKVLGDQGITTANVKIIGFACYSHHVRFADRWRVGRVFLAGDAAHAMPPWIGQGMCAGVRDVGKPVLETGRRAVAGRCPSRCSTPIRPSGCRTSKRSPTARSRSARSSSTAIRCEPPCAITSSATASKVPGFTTWLRKTPLASPARYEAGCWRGTATPQRAGSSPSRGSSTKRATGCAWTTSSAAGGRSLHTGPDRTVAVLAISGRADHQNRTSRAAPPTPTQIVDHDGALTRWLRDKKASVVAVRPDGFVYAGAGDTQPLPPPPAGLTAPVNRVKDHA